MLILVIALALFNSIIYCIADHDTLQTWIRTECIQQMELDILTIFKDYKISDIEQLQSQGLPSVDAIWQHISNRMKKTFRNAVKNGNDSVESPDHDGIEEEESDGHVTIAVENEEIYKYREILRIKTDELNETLLNNDLQMFFDVFVENDIFLNELLSNNSDDILNMLHQHNVSFTPFDEIKLKLSITKLKNKGYIDTANTMYLELKQKHNMYDHEKDIINKWKEQQSKMQDVNDIFVNISKYIQKEFSHRTDKVMTFIQNIQQNISHQQSKLILSLKQYETNKITELEEANDHLLNYTDVLQQTLNEMYRNIESEGLNANERKGKSSEYGKRIYQDYPQYGNASLFAHYMNNISSIPQIKFKELSVTDVIDYNLETGYNMVIPTLNIINITQHTLSSSKQVQAETNIIWKYAFSQENTKISNICNQINMFTNNVLYTHDTVQLTNNETTITCNSSVIINDYDPFGTYEFRIEYELLFPVEITISDSINIETYQLQQLLEDGNLMMFFQAFKDKNIYLHHILNSHENASEITMNVLNNNTCSDQDTFNSLRLITAISKWRNGQILKLNQDEIFSISKLLNMPSDDKLSINFVPNELHKIKHLYNFLLNALSDLELSYTSNLDQIDAVFDILSKRKESLKQKLVNWKQEKFDSMIDSLNQIETHYRSLNQLQNDAYRYIEEHKQMDENVILNITTYIHNHMISLPYFDVTFKSSDNLKVQFLTRNFGSFKSMDSNLIPMINILNVTVSKGKNEDGMLQKVRAIYSKTVLTFNAYIVWTYTQYNIEGDIHFLNGVCSKINMYYNDKNITKNTTTAQIVASGAQSEEEIIKYYCNSTIHDIRPLVSNNSYVWKIEYVSETPITTLVYDEIQWTYIETGTTLSWITWIIIILVILTLLIVVFVCARK